MKINEFSKGKIIILVIISFLVTLLFWDKNTTNEIVIQNNIIGKGIIIVMSFICNIFTPLKLYTTAIHEGWHAIVTIITGGSINEISLLKDGSGHVLSQGGIFLLIAPAGYIGSAITGGILIISAKKEFIAKIVLFVISSVILFLNSIYIDSYFSIAFISSILMSIFLIISVFKTNNSSYIAIFLGTILAVDSFGDIKKIIFQIPYQTDAGLLAKNLGIEFMTIPIAIIFSVICMYIWWLSIKYIMKSS